MGGIVSSILDPITGAGQARDAANNAAASQRQAATTASYAAQFRPVGMTTAFGTSNFTREIDPATGMPYISSAGYQASPELQALQNQILGNLGSQYSNAQNVAGQYAPLTGGASSLFNLGQQYLATSPADAAKTWFNQQQGLLAPGREQALANVQNQQFQAGRSGLGVGGTRAGYSAGAPGLAQSNPQLAALYNAQAQQDAGLAAQADQYGMQRAQFGAGLFGTGSSLLNQYNAGQVAAYSPFANQLSMSGNVENMAMQPYNLGMQLGSAAAPGQAAGAQMYNTGFGQAAGTQYAGAQNAANLNAGFLSSLIGSAAGAAGGAPSGGGAAYNTATNNWMTNPASAGTNFSGGIFGGGSGAFTLNKY